jgi:pilus assembly protein CpaF
MRTLGSCSDTPYVQLGHSRSFLKIPLRDVSSMQCRQPSLEGTGQVPLRRLVREALRMRPSRIVVGRVRQAESPNLQIALNSGLPEAA